MAPGSDTTRKDARLAVRLTPDQDALIRDAASAAGQSLTEFVLAAGEASLDRCLAERALTNHVADISRSYVCTDSQTQQILGYYTLSAVAISHASLSGRARRNAPDPVPAVLLGRLAVDLDAQGSGLGKLLVRDAILSTIAAGGRIGVRVLLVHALHERAATFCASLGFERSPTDPLHLFVLLADAPKSLGS